MSEKDLPVKRLRGRPRKNLSTKDADKQKNVEFQLKTNTDMLILPKDHGNQNKNTAKNIDKNKQTAKATQFVSDTKRDSLKKSGKKIATFEDKLAHQKREQRRKASISLWINKLGNLLFKEDSSKQLCKRSILEKAYDYIQKREQNRDQDTIDDSSENELTTRVKDLEASIILLLGILKKHDINPPKGLPIPSSIVCATPDTIFPTASSAAIFTTSSGTQTTATQNRDEPTEKSQPPTVSATLSNTSTDGIQIHLVLPRIPLSHMMTSSVITLSATAANPLNSVINKTISPNDIKGLTSSKPVPKSLAYSHVTSSGDTQKKPISSTMNSPPVGSIIGSTSITKTINTAVASIITSSNTSTTTSKSSIIIPSVESPAIVTSTLVKPSDSEKNESIDFQKDNVPLSSTHQIQSTSKCHFSPSITVLSSNPSSSTVTVRSDSQTGRPIQASGESGEVANRFPTPQGFGIDNLLVSNVTSTTNHTNSANKQEILSKKSNINIKAMQPSSTVKNVKSPRQRLPSSGHTVASLLEPNTTSARCNTYNSIPRNNENVAGTPVNNELNLPSSFLSAPHSSSQAKTLNPASSSQSTSHSAHHLQPTPNSTSQVQQTSISASHLQPTSNSSFNPQPTSNPKQTNVVSSSSNPSSSKRWSSFVENAQNSDDMFMSFVLTNKTKGQSKRKRKRTTRGVKQTRTDNEGSPTVATNANSSMKEIQEKTSSQESKVATSTPSTAQTLIDTLSPLPQNKTPIIAESSTSQPSPTKYTDLKPYLKSVTCSLGTTTKSVNNTTPKNTTVNKNIWADHSTTRVSATFDSTHLNLPITSIQQALVTSENVTMTTTPPVRTMKDRTVKNKWHRAEQTQVSTALSISTTGDIPSEQCASPVISYPNTGKRRRKTSFNTTNQSNNSTNKSAISTSNSQSTSKNFSAESLSRPSRNNAVKRPRIDGKPNPINNNTQTNITRERPMRNTNFTPQGNSQQRFQMPADISNSLPTILNIFAPAPVPPVHNTQQQQQQQQQSLQSGFSNFSAENLVSNECHLDVMDGNTLNETNFSENMLMAANSQLFTNFSADSLVAGNDPQSSIPFAINNLINPQQNNTWNQPWLAQDLNETIFQNMNSSTQISNNPVRQNNRSLLPVQSTECSPIKSIMSILNSTTHNANPNFHFENPLSGISGNLFSSNNPGQRAFSRDNRMNMLSDTTDFMMNTQNAWINKNSSTALQRNSSNSNTPFPTWTPHSNMMMSRSGLKNGANQSDIYSGTFPQNNKIQSSKTRESSGPMFGNVSLVNSITPT